jgi:hypothetical protein
MNGWSTLNRTLRTDPRDAGCAATLSLLDRYAERVAGDPAAAARDFPGIVVHLGYCDACSEDLAGLLAALGEYAG